MLYFVIWPVDVEPVAWKAPPDKGCSGVFAVNNRLKDIETLPIGNVHGPEDIALDDQGRIYAATGEGIIIHLQADGSNPENWV